MAGKEDSRVRRVQFESLHQKQANTRTHAISFLGLQVRILLLRQIIRPSSLEVEKIAFAGRLRFHV